MKLMAWRTPWHAARTGAAGSLGAPAPRAACHGRDWRRWARGAEGKGGGEEGERKEGGGRGEGSREGGGKGGGEGERRRARRKVGASAPRFGVHRVGGGLLGAAEDAGHGLIEGAGGRGVEVGA